MYCMLLYLPCYIDTGGRGQDEGGDLDQLSHLQRCWTQILSEVLVHRWMASGHFD